MLDRYYSKEIPLGDGKTKYIKVVQSKSFTEMQGRPGSDPESLKWSLILAVTQTREMTDCEGHGFERMKLFNNGTRWVMEFEIVVDAQGKVVNHEPTTQTNPRRTQGRQRTR